MIYKLSKNRLPIWTASEGSDSIRETGEQVTLNRLLPLAAFASGSYVLEVLVEDRVSGQSLAKTAEFQIKP